MNFRKETLEAIIKSGHSEQDVMFIGTSDGKYRVDIDKFKDISDFEYNSGYGAAEIPQDLIVYFKDKSYISRGEYDGSEWWEYSSPLDYAADDDSKSITIISRGSWIKYQQGVCECGRMKDEHENKCEKCSYSLT